MNEVTKDRAANGQPLKTTVVGSYPQPEWLIDKAVLRGQFVPRVTSGAMWRVGADALQEALQDATLLAIRELEEAGLDTITDGEICRESYTNHFSVSLAGFDHEHPAVIANRVGRDVKVPRVVGPVRHQRAVEVEWARFLRTHTQRRTKVTLPGPFTMAQQVKDEHYGDVEALTLDLAAAVNVEARLLQAAGIDQVQIDEPWLRNDPAAARRFGVKAINRALEGLEVETAVHLCFGYAFLRPTDKPNVYEFLAELAGSVADEIVVEAAQPKIDMSVLKELASKNIAVGVLDHSTPDAEPVSVIADRLRSALKFVPPERLLATPDCGMKYMSRDVARRRLRHMCAAAALVRREITGQAPHAA